MLFFDDQEKAIKVSRLVEDGAGVKRVRLGRIQKSKMEIDGELRQALEGDEAQEVQGVIEMYAGARTRQMSLDVARFPEVMRHVLEFVASGKASDGEVRMVVAGVTEALRQLRRLDRAAVAA